MKKPQPNRLANASSPYLLQHANNPVDWYEWGPEALRKAKVEDRPLIISIGYSACHWCHVMERESYMDSAVAGYMNKYFVSIKVDREERPDIDQIYIEAAQLLNGNAGWPLHVFALPNGKPFWVGTYFPKQNWLTVLEQLHKVYIEDQKTVLEQANRLTDGLKKEPLINVAQRDNSPFNKEDYKSLFSDFETNIDFEKGGVKATQKFPMPMNWEFLLQYYELTRNEKALQAVKVTLKAMAFGGIYDQLAGGFSRYAVDEDWFAPHFEKMLYDNAQLVSVYAQAYQLTKKPLYKTIVEETLEFIKREMTDKSGGFYSALNADSEGKEGKFYVWKMNEIREILSPEETELFKNYYNLRSNGNWEDGQNILYRKESNADFAKQYDLSEKKVEVDLAFAKAKLMDMRNQRIRPSTDDKILVSWNALMLKAYVDAYCSLGDRQYLQVALKNAEFIHTNMQTKDGGLYRNYKNGKASTPGFLDDYAFTAEAFVSLYQVTLDKKWLTLVKNLVDDVLLHFQSKETELFYYSSDKGESLIARKTEIIDNVLPSSNAVMAKVLYELGEYYDNQKYKTRSKKMLSIIKPNILKAGTYFSKWAGLLGMESYLPYEIAITGAKAKEKLRDLQKHYLPTALYSGGIKEDLPLLKNKLIDGKTMIYVCQNKICRQPVETVEAALKEMTNKQKSDT